MILAFEYEYPEKLALENGEVIFLDQDDMKDERSLAIVIPKDRIWNLASYLYDQGFSDAEPAWNQGEKYSLSRIVNDPWELHLRIFENGQIFPHVEVRREFFQHLEHKYIWPVYYEAMKYIGSFTDATGLLYLKTNQWVSSIQTIAKRSISAPTSLTEWKPIVSFIAGALVGTTITYSLMKLWEYMAEPPRLITTSSVEREVRKIQVEIPIELAKKLGILEEGNVGFYEHKGSIIIQKV